MVRRLSLRGTGYLLASLFILGLTFGATLANESGADGSTSAQIMGAKNRLDRVRAGIGVHQRHWRRLMDIPEVVGSGIGLGSDGGPVIKVLTARHGVKGVPDRLEGVPVHTQVSGR